jgi:hypothetical protein
LNDETGNFGRIEEKSPELQVVYETFQVIAIVSLSLMILFTDMIFFFSWLSQITIGACAKLKLGILNKGVGETKVLPFSEFEDSGVITRVLPKKDSLFRPNNKCLDESAIGARENI